MDLTNEHGARPASALEIVANNEPSRLRAETTNLSAVWADLIAGSSKINGAEFTEQSCSLIVVRELRVTRPPTAMSKRQSDVLERSLLDGARKSVASDLGLCPSSVAEILKQGFRFMGLECWPSRIPLLLVMAAHARRQRELDRSAAVVAVETPRFLRQTISVSRPDSELVSRLTPAEYACTRLLVEGRSYAEIAVVRETSARTVANQLAAAFHRLGVSGRGELLCLLARRRAAVFESPSFASHTLREPFTRVSGFRRAAGG